MSRRLIVAALFLFVVALPIKSQQGWVATRVAPSGQDLNTVYFLDNKRGWVGGDNGFLSHTEDGGHTWLNQLVQTKASTGGVLLTGRAGGGGLRRENLPGQRCKLAAQGEC